MATTTSESLNVPLVRTRSAISSRSGGASLRMRIPVSLPGDVADPSDERRVLHPGGPRRARHSSVRADVAVRIDVDDIGRAVLRDAEVDAAVIAQVERPERGDGGALDRRPGERRYVLHRDR